MSEEELEKEDEHQKSGYHPDAYVMTLSNVDNAGGNSSGVYIPGFQNTITALTDANLILPDSEKFQVENLTLPIRNTSITQPEEAWEKYVPRWNFRDFWHCMQFQY